MSKEESIKDFLNALKISFKNASMYGIEHPAFSESASKLKEKSTKLFEFLIPISLGFTSDSLFIDGRYWERGRLYKEIAKIFIPDMPDNETFVFCHRGLVRDVLEELISNAAIVHKQPDRKMPVEIDISIMVDTQKQKVTLQMLDRGSVSTYRDPNENSKGGQGLLRLGRALYPYEASLEHGESLDDSWDYQVTVTFMLGGE